MNLEPKERSASDSEEMEEEDMAQQNEPERGQDFMYCVVCLCVYFRRHE